MKIRVAKGLVALHNKEWEKAGRELGEVGEEGGLGEWEGEAISSQDIALITALCTLATSSRERIRRVLLDRMSFRSAVDDSNKWVLELVRSFVDAEYGRVLEILTKNEVGSISPAIVCRKHLRGRRNEGNGFEVLLNLGVFKLPGKGLSSYYRHRIDYHLALARIQS